MSKWTQLVLRAIVFLLILAIIGTGAAITRYALFADTLKAPRTELERAELLAVQAVKANPNDAQARTKLAAVYLEMGRVEAAIKEAKTAARLAPDKPDTYYALGLAYEKKGELALAATNIQKACTMPGQLADFYQNSWLELAKVHEAQNNYKGAIKDYDLALGNGPENAPILYEMARAYEHSGDKATALAYYKEVLEYVPDYQDALKAIERLNKEGVVASKTVKPSTSKTHTTTK